MHSDKSGQCEKITLHPEEDKTLNQTVCKHHNSTFPAPFSPFEREISEKDI